MLDGFSDRELAQFTRLLERFSVQLIRQEDTGDGLCMRCSAYYEEACPVDHLRDGCPYQNARQNRRGGDERKTA